MSFTTQITTWKGPEIRDNISCLGNRDDDCDWNIASERESVRR